MARFETGLADSAIDQIKRTYGWMDSHDPGITQWEGIGPNGSLYEDGYTSMAHGWPTGVLPALTHQLLGAKPTSPGYATCAVRPHPGSVRWTQGELSTPHGKLGVKWVREDGRFTLTVRVPRSTRGSVALPTDGHRVALRAGDRTLWSDGRARASGVRLDAGYLALAGLAHGTHRFTLVRES
ncbi:alpha-L-rhamnosidase C-terminal domain-containing protein [Streptomyces sp. NPDC091266]|uniref:alpha-L-rhamnosidase C-terminal domain-containing protein n=1 Tax=Streptomyces sp. NPDC091266 TaxID=3365978 RepID=UPI00381EAC1A